VIGKLAVVCVDLMSVPICCIYMDSRAEDIGGDSGIAEENRAILERVRMNTRQEYLAEGKASGSVRATDRLMRELQDIYRSKNYKSGWSRSGAGC